jgi:hypothetical protein
MYQITNVLQIFTPSGGGLYDGLPFTAAPQKIPLSLARFRSSQYIRDLLQRSSVERLVGYRK